MWESNEKENIPENKMHFPSKELQILPHRDRKKTHDPATHRGLSAHAHGQQ
ncbi:unnamed protein product [Lepidochelys olivacea]